ncbi:MAG: Bug family tripartite tricarboxylate transporter substrate binding protein, partial [Burkholderiaceae bacterium]
MKSGVLLRAAAAIAVAVCTLPLAAPPAAAQPLVFVVPYPPGGSTDVIPRLLTPIVSRTAKTSVIVENRPGANGSIGAAHVARAAPDGHTVLMAPTGVLSINQWLYKQLPYKPERDLAPITNAATTPNMVVVSSSLPINSLQELIAMAKAKPDTLTFASSGNGSTSHLCGELLRKMAGIDIVHVPYKGPGPAMQDVLSGRVTMMCEAVSNAMVHVRSGRLRALVLAAQQPHPQA